MALKPTYICATNATIACLVFFLLTHVDNRKDYDVQPQISSLEASIRSLESQVLHHIQPQISSLEASIRSLETQVLHSQSSSSNTQDRVQGSLVQKAPVVYAGVLELPDPQPLLPFTLFGRQVQIADFGRAHKRQTAR